MNESMNPNQEPLPKPLQEAADLLRATSQEPSVPMDAAVKLRQRAAILAHATQTAPAAASAPVIVPMDQPKTSKQHHPFRNFSFGFAGVLAAIALVLVFASPSGMFKLPGSSNVSLALSIPAAHAGDAFLLTTDKSDASGASKDTTFTITSKVDVDPQILKQSLTVYPPVDVDVTKTGNGEYKVTPKGDLSPGETYRFSISTEIDQGDGTKTRRVFSWALQTKDEFRVLSSLPGDGKSMVPVSTGIEFKFTRDGWTDATSSFAITPAVPGRFEAHGRTMSFIPNAPLAYGQRYEVVLKKGFGTGQGDNGLAQDLHYRFETEVAPKTGVQSQYPVEVSLTEFHEISPLQTWKIPNVYLDQRVTGFSFQSFRLTKDEARRLMDSRLNLPEWAPIERGKFAAYEQAVKTPVAEGEVTLARLDTYVADVQFPALEAGFYAIKLTPKSAQGGVPSWVFVQSTDVAAYLTADKDTLLAWTINPSTGRPLSNERVRIGGQETKSDMEGLARLQTPAILTATTSAEGDVAPHQLIDFGDETSGLLQPIKRSSDGYWMSYGNRDSGVSKTWGYIYLDRPLYRPQDGLKLFGIAQDRDQRQGVGQVELRLRKQDFWFDMGTGLEKTYQTKTVQTDSAGRFEGSFDWNQLGQGYYMIEVRRGDVVVTSRAFEVREFVKPSYQISLVLDKSKYVEGESLSGTVKANFYEGTPVPHLKLALSWMNEKRTIETDAAGVARFTADYRMSSCPALAGGVYGCWKTENVTFEVHPEGGEEGDVYANAYATMYRSEAGTMIEARSSTTTAYVRATVWKNNLALDDDGKTQPWANRSVTFTSFGHRWEKRADGYVYDYIEKKNVQRYRYENVWDAPIVVTAMTDNKGIAAYEFPMISDREYSVFMETKDDRGRVTRDVTWIWPGQNYGSSYGRSMPSDNVWSKTAYPSLDLTPHDNPNGPIGFSLDQSFTATYLLGEAPIDASKTPGVLFLVASRGLRKSEVKQANSDTFRFEEAWMPNAQVHAITWRDGHFEAVQASANFRSEDKALLVEATPEKSSYAPGEVVRVKVTTKRKSDGQAVPDTKLVWGAVDKSLLAASYDNSASPLSDLYGYVSDGIIFSARSHDNVYDGFGGAEMGGGGGMAARLAMNEPRKNFKDTAGFGVVTTDSTGAASISFLAPDNITGWRFEIVGITPGLEAGEGRTDVNVTKPVFVDLVAPPRLLTTDKPVLKLRAYGAGLVDGEDVTFAIKAPTLGIDQEVSGKANQAVFVAIPTLVDGKHTMTIGVSSSHGTDALERQVTIESSRFLRDTLSSVQAAPGTGLPAIGQAETTLTLAPMNRAALEPLVNEIAWGYGSARVDALLASRVGLQILKDDFHRDDWWLPNADDISRRLVQYQYGAGGIALLPYASGDLQLSSEMAATAPEYLDREGLAVYFWNALDDKANGREQQVEAMAGLSALGEPVLPSLQAAAGLSDLTWREQLVIARGLTVAGDTERARGLLGALLSKSVTRDNLTSLHVSEVDAENYEATADAAAIAAQVSDPKAAELMRFVQTNWQKDAFPVLARARYLKAVLPTLGNREITLGYTLGDAEKTIVFKDGYIQSLTLTADEASRFRVTKVDGPITLSFVKRETGRPTSVPEVSIKRTYEGPADLSSLHEGDPVTISLVPEWKSNAQDGCYVVRDHLPGGWQAMISGGGPMLSKGARLWYPFLVENGEASFTVCKGQSDPITYVARVVTAGTYTAEAPLIQHQEFPSVASVGQDQTVTIK
ncbi:MAG: Ig-like domain-containing protein [Candidatus Uhrbacteria bacterium]